MNRHWEMASDKVNAYGAVNTPCFTFSDLWCMFMVKT